MALEIYLEGTLNGEVLAEREASQNGRGLRSDGELVQAVRDTSETDAFVFASGGTAPSGGFSDVSGLGAEVTVAEYRDGTEHSPEWTNPNDGDPGHTAAGSDPEWRYVPVRRFFEDSDTDLGLSWDDGLF
jgi:hypothetical protein